MDSFQSPILSRTVSRDTFEQLRSLWQWMGKEPEVAIAEENSIGDREEPQQFLLLTSAQLSLLLWGRSQQEGLFYQVRISWDKRAIADLLALIGSDELLARYRGRLDSIQSSVPQSDFLLRLLDILTPNSSDEFDSPYPYVSVCQPVEEALRQQVNQERLLNQVIAQIHQSLDLSVILETVVKEVRTFLEVDRLVIYQFIPRSSSSPKNQDRAWGKIVYESKASDSIPSILNLTAEDNCFTYVPRYQEKYCAGLVVAIENVEKAYSSSFCLAELLSEHQIKAKLIAPIVVRDKLWGLLIAHECFKTRHWSENEQNFLGQIGEHLAVAIYQAQLYAEVQQQKNSFEQRVIERTQELRDTLVAAQTASRSKSEFLNNISHELRTPLTNIIGLSSTLLNWFGKTSTLSVEKQQQYLKSIQASGRQLLELIDEIIDFSQIEAGKTFLNIQAVSPIELAKVVLKYLQEEARQKKIILNLDDRTKGKQNKFYLDAQRVQQILFQLLKNALKFTPSQGTVILRNWQENNYAVFQVRDTGIGISKDRLPLLFQTFQQLEESRKRTYGGTGLGLALTKQLVELHRGTIEVESSPGKGSTFTVRLPSQSQPQLSSVPISQSDRLPYGEVKSVILVERDEEIATLICELLTAATYQVVWLMDSNTAIEQIQLLQPSVLILDSELPDIRHISQRLKQSQLTKSIRILLIINRISSIEWEELAGTGVDDYLLKPIQPNLLLQRLEALTSKKNDLNNSN